MEICRQKKEWEQTEVESGLASGVDQNQDTVISKQTIF